MIENYNPDVLTCLANLSNDEVFTPPNQPQALFDLLEYWKTIYDSPAPFKLFLPLIMR